MVTLTVGGLPGSGTTTACRKLQEKLGLRYVYAGQLFREMARERDMTLAEFSRFCEDHPEVDRALDDKQLELLQEGDLILEGRLSGWLATQNDIPALTVWLWAPVDVRAQRVANREGGDLREKKLEMLEREFSEAKRYKNFYGFDIQDQRIYDLLIKTDVNDPDQVVALILAELEGRKAQL